MSLTRMTAPMRRSLEIRLEELDRRIAGLDAQREDDDSMEAMALMEQLIRERSDVEEALRGATLIDDEPFDTEAIEIGDTVALQDSDGEVERYILVDAGVRARSDWVSVTSPLGAAIIGRSKGERVRVESPVGTNDYLIVDFERASDDPRLVASARGQTRSRTLKLLSEGSLG